MIVMSEKEYRNFKEALSMFTKLKLSFAGNNGEEKIAIDRIQKELVELRKDIKVFAIGNDRKKMTRAEAIAVLRSDYTKKVSHISFGEKEYLIGDIGNYIYTEEGYVFEDWSSPHRDGFRVRTGEEWENGWFIKE